MACIIDHHFTRALVDSAVLRCVRSRTTMYSCSSFTEVRPCANNLISRSMGATISVPNMNNGVSVYKWVRLRTVCIVSDINDAVHVEAKRDMSARNAKWWGNPHLTILSAIALIWLEKQYSCRPSFSAVMDTVPVEYLMFFRIAFPSGLLICTKYT